MDQGFRFSYPVATGLPHSPLGSRISFNPVSSSQLTQDPDRVRFRELHQRADGRELRLDALIGSLAIETLNAKLSISSDDGTDSMCM